MQQAITAKKHKAKSDAAHVSKWAWKAFFAAAGTSATPAKYASVAAGVGYDPLSKAQEAMVREISSSTGRDLRHVHSEHSLPLKGHAIARTSRGLVRTVGHAARKVGIVSKTAGPYRIAFEIITAGISGACAYWDTKKLGMACLAAADIKQGSE